jgi:hypothetical protein
VNAAEGPIGAGLRKLESAPRVTFCGYCGERPDGSTGTESRICPRCKMGLLLQTPRNLAPRSSDPFVVTDGQMRLRAVSELAERVLGVSEVEAVDRSLDEFLVPAETTPAAAARLRATLCEVAVSPYGSNSPGAAVLRPRDTYGVRHGVRIVPCEPGPAALIVFEEAL